MFKVKEDMSIHVTRGDAVSFNVTAQQNGEAYKFRKGDIVRFNVFEKKSCDCVLMKKDTTIEEETTSAVISLSMQDTKIGDVFSKPTDYWYEVELNPETKPQTIIGYDENGPKIFRLYPEGGVTG